jgi:hypothetical protein
MSNGRHVSYRGIPVDMEALRNENANTLAVGNMKVNAKGDLLGKGGVVAKTVDQIARENQRVRTAIQSTGLKGDIPESVEEIVKPAAKVPKAKVERELPNGDIIQEDAK